MTALQVHGLRRCPRCFGPVFAVRGPAATSRCKKRKCPHYREWLVFCPDAGCSFTNACRVECVEPKPDQLPPRPLGPYTTEREAADAVMPRAWFANSQRHDRDKPVTIVLDSLLNLCALRGVELGEFDRRTLEWLVRWEATTVQVVMGLVDRAARAAVRTQETER